MSEETTKRNNGESEPKESVPDRRIEERHVISDAERIKEMRERLYARDRQTAASISARHSFTPIPPLPTESSRSQTAQPSGSQNTGGTENSSVMTPAQEAMMQKKPKHTYRLRLMVAALVFFVCALGVAGAFLFYGKNTSSGNNITIGINGPVTVDGGQPATFQIAVANQNTAPIQSAVLIITYPVGTQMTDGSGKELTTERRAIDNIGALEVVNVSVPVLVFGEQNEDKQIKAAIEYRVSGSNATFSKETDPLHFKIGSSPVSVTVDTVKNISSGQQADITLTITSNSQTPLTDLLVKATYPSAFDMGSANPEPIAGENTWSIAALKPNAKTTIVVHGIITGNQNDIPHFTFVVGVPNQQDRFSLASTLSSATADISIEQPFLAVSTTVNGDSGSTISIADKGLVNMQIKVKNTLPTSVYDGVVKVVISGNAVNQSLVRAMQGFYDSTTNTVTWDSSSNPLLKELTPGNEQVIGLSLTPSTDAHQAPQIDFKVTVSGKRLSGDSVPEQLSGIVQQTVKIESTPKFSANAIYSDGPFTNTGPVPPVAEKVTQFSLLFSVESGVNDLTGASVTAVLPQYVSWLDLVSHDNDVSFDATSHTMKWNIGNISANSHKEVWIQVSFLPSLSQVDTTPTVLKASHFVATDRFTGTTVRVDGSPLSSSFSNDPDATKRTGTVQRR